MRYITIIDFYLDSLLLINIFLLIAFPTGIVSGFFGYISTIFNIIFMERMERIIDIFISNNSKRQIIALIRLLIANFFFVHIMATLLLGLTLVESS